MANKVIEMDKITMRFPFEIKLYELKWEKPQGISKLWGEKNDFSENFTGSLFRLEAKIGKQTNLQEQMPQPILI